MTTKTKTKHDRMLDVLRANGIGNDVLKRWSEASTAMDTMALPSGSEVMRIASYIGWSDLTEKDKEYLSWVTPGDVHDFLQSNNGKDVTFLVNTPGGSVFGGTEMANLIIGYEGKTTAIVTGIAASCGSLVTAACDEVVMMESSMVMIHGPHTYAMGAAQDFRDIADRLDKEAEMVAPIYKKRMDDDLVDTMLASGDHEFIAKDAMENGFADSIYTAPTGDDADKDQAQINTDDHMGSEGRTELAKRNDARLSFLATGILT